MSAAFDNGRHTPLGWIPGRIRGKKINHFTLLSFHPHHPISFLRPGKRVPTRRKHDKMALPNRPRQPSKTDEALIDSIPARVLKEFRDSVRYVFLTGDASSDAFLSRFMQHLTSVPMRPPSSTTTGSIPKS